MEDLDIGRSGMSIEWIPVLTGLTILFLCDLCASVAMTLVEKTKPILERTNWCKMLFERNL